VLVLKGATSRLDGTSHYDSSWNEPSWSSWDTSYWYYRNYLYRLCPKMELYRILL